MPTESINFHSVHDRAILRACLSDPRFVASLIPQVVGVEKTGATTALWTVLVKVGPLSRQSLYEGRVVEATDASVRFTALGPEATIEGSLSLDPDPTGGTRVGLTISMNGSGPFRSVVDSYLAKRLRGDVTEFARSLDERTATRSPSSGG